jgi:hypothetical protein
VQRSGTSDRVEGGVGNVAIDLAANHEPGATVDDLEARPSGPERGIDVASKGVECLVVVAVEVEELESSHPSLPYIRLNRACNARPVQPSTNTIRDVGAVNDAPPTVLW